MRRTFVRTPLLLTALAALPLAQAPAGGADPVQVRPAGVDVLDAYGLSAGEVLTLDLPTHAGEPFGFALYVEGAWREIQVAPYSVRAEGYELRVQSGDEMTVHPPTVESSYRGTVDGFADSLVAVNLYEGQLQGILRLTPGGALYGLQPVNELVPSAAADEHLVYAEDSVMPVDAQCGGALSALRGELGGAGSDPVGADGTDTKIAQIACDADFEFYQSNGSSVTATENDITAIINACEAIYEADADILYEITVIYVETSEPDPYSTSSASGLLGQFQSHWNSAAHASDPRDVAHLFTGKNLSGSTIGIAYLNVICNLGSAYGLSQSKFSGSFTSRVGLTAHELGHNWSANHCDGASDCWIMCSGLGGCGGSLTMFGNGSTNAILNEKATSGCLATAPPPVPPFLTGLSGGTSQAFQGSQQTLSGFFLEDVTEISVGGVSLFEPFGFTVVSDNQITFNAPVPTALGTVSVVAINGAGSSNPVSLTYVETDPAKLGATGVGLTGLAFNWTVGGGVDDLYFLAVSLNDNTTFPLFGADLLLNGTLVASGNLNNVGLANFGIITPTGASGALVYSQAITFDPSTLAFESATNITVSSILL